MAHKEVKMTLAERENLMTDHIPHYSGFTPQRLQRLTARRRPHTITDIECRHFLRTSTHEFTHQQPSVEHRLWMEAGKAAVPVPIRQDTSYNSNIWRNFNRGFGLCSSARDKGITEAIAALYPINIPPPSQVGDCTFDKYLRESDLFKNEKTKILAIQRAATEINEFRNLKCKTDARNPPINERGDILPPENFKKYSHRFVPIPSPPPSPPPPGQKPDMFGRLYTPRSQPVLWRLSYKLNHPNFHKLQDEIKVKKEMAEQMKKFKETNNFPPVRTSPLLSYTPSDV